MNTTIQKVASTRSGDDAMEEEDETPLIGIILDKGSSSPLIKTELNDVNEEEDTRNKKRDDLQCWRGYSIIAVLLFHLWRNFFPNGFVGVDIFFVLSGFLMSKIYCQEAKIFSLKNVLEFYFKRIKRIVPIYLLIILFLFIVLSKVLFAIELNIILIDAIWASLFLTNIQDFITKLNYFDVQSTSRFFRHCWSLSVEMQFYLIFPFIAFLKTKISLNFYRSFLLILFILSFFNQITRTNPIEAYESTFSRLWQFMVGILAESIIFKKGNIYFYHATSAFIIMAIIFPVKVPSIILNLIVILTGLILTYSASMDVLPLGSISKIFNFVYFGNISYVLYLIHWPLITYMKYTTIHKNLSFFDGFTFGMASILFSIVLHNFIEKPVMTFCDTWKKLATTIGLLYFVFFISIKFYPFIFTINNTETTTSNNIKLNKNNMSLAEIISENQKLANFSILEEFPCLNNPLEEELGVKLWANDSGYRCSHALILNATTKKEAVIMGNSYAGYQYAGITTALKQLNFTKVYLFGRAACLPHGGELNLEWSSHQCNLWSGNVFDKFLIAAKPEVIIITARLSMYEGLMKPLPPNPTATDLLKNDFGVQQLHASIMNFSKFSKKLIIISPNPDIDFQYIKIDPINLQRLQNMISFNYTSPLSIAKRFEQGGNIDDFILPLNYVYEVTHAPEERLTAAMNQCLNCVFLNTTKIFCNENGFPLFDERKLGILKDKAHLTRIGASKLTQPIINLLI